MENDKKPARSLTQSILLGVSAGTIVVAQIGCAPVTTGDAAASAEAAQIDDAAVQRLCARALETNAVSDVEALLRRAPDADCVPPLLAALPPSTLSQVSPDLLGGLPTASINRLPEQIRGQVRQPFWARDGGTDRNVSDGGGDSGGGGGDSGGGGGY